MKGAQQADDSGLARTRRAHQRSHRSGLGLEADAVQDRLLRLVGKLHILESHVALISPSLTVRAGIGEFVLLGQDLHGAVDPRHRLGELRADIHHLNDRRDHERQKHGVLDVGAVVHLVLQTPDARPAASPVRPRCPAPWSPPSTARWSWSATSSRCPAGAARRHENSSPRVPRRGSPSPRARRPAIRSAAPSLRR